WRRGSVERWRLPSSGAGAVVTDSSHSGSGLTPRGAQRVDPSRSRRWRRVRADQRMVGLGLVPSGSQAQWLIRAGRVYCQDRRIEKPGQWVEASAPLVVQSGTQFVSRGGEKLLGALDDLALEVTDFTCVDVGASTGGVHGLPAAPRSSQGLRGRRRPRAVGCEVA
ncbi:hypothetical protein ACFL5O_12315, partial [Myxococcota bacterium]